MPTPAQDRSSRGPFAALLILLGLVLGSAPAAGADLRGPTARLGSSRHAPAVAMLQSPAGSALDDESRGAGAGPSPLPARSEIVTSRLWARPTAAFRALPSDRSQRPAGASHRARAPPAA